MNQSFWGHSRWDVQKNLDLLMLLSSLNTANPARNAQSLSPVQTTDRITYYSPLRQAPAILLIEDNVSVAVFLGGTNFSDDQVGGLIRGYSSPSRYPSSTRGCNPVFIDALNSFFPQLTAALYNDNRKKYIVGYSYGGALACVLAKSLSANVPNVEIQLNTFGQPRPGNIDFANAVYPLSLARWWLPEDPVRYIPPHSDECPALTLLSATELVQGMNSQVQPSFGASISDNGFITFGQGSPGPGNIVAWSIAQWIAGAQGFNAPKHSLSEYIRRFELAIPQNQFPRPDTTNVPTEQPEVLTRGELDRIREREAPILTQQVNDGVAPPLNVTITQGVLPPNAPGTTAPPRYRVKKLGRIWGVTFKGDVVAIGPGKRTAKQIRRRLNRTLQALQP